MMVPEALGWATVGGLQSVLWSHVFNRAIHVHISKYVCVCIEYLLPRNDAGALSVVHES